MFSEKSSLNWSQAGLDIANNGIVELGSSIAVVLVGGDSLAATHFIVDITGYLA